MVPPTFTRRCTQPGEAAASGSMTCDGSPIAIFGWACKTPSRIHTRPKPIRSSFRQAGSAMAGPCGSAAAPAPAPPAAGVQVRMVIQASPASAKMSRAISPWCTSAALNAATTVGSLTLMPEFIPGMTSPAPVTQARQRNRRLYARTICGHPCTGSSIWLALHDASPASESENM